jgi:hypothetical protein
VRTRLDGLCEDKSITFNEWRAACSYRAIVEFVLAATSPGSTLLSLGSAGGGGWRDVSPEALDAQSRISEIDHSFAPIETWTLMHFLIDDAPFTAFAEYWDIDPRTVKKKLVRLLRRLGRVSWQ